MRNIDIFANALTIVLERKKYVLWYPKELDLTIRFATDFTALHKIATSLILCFCIWKTCVIMLFFYNVGCFKHMRGLSKVLGAGHNHSSNQCCKYFSPLSWSFPLSTTTKRRSTTSIFFSVQFQLYTILYKICILYLFTVFMCMGIHLNIICVCLMPLEPEEYIESPGPGQLLIVMWVL